MNIRKQLEKQIEDLEATKKAVLNRIAELQSNKMFLCACNKRHKIKNCDAVRFWEKPVGYDDDGGWSHIFVACPNGVAYNRPWFSDVTYDLPYEERHKYENNIEQQFNRIYAPLFKSITNIEHDCHKFVWKNNDYFGKHYKKFDLEIAYYEKLKQKLKDH